MKGYQPSEEEGAVRVPVSMFARRFGDVLRVGDGRAAELIVDEALETGLTAEVVQSQIIEPALVRIGELWEAGSITVADEHLATSISQRSMVRLFDVLCARRDGPVSRERIMLAAVEGQHHVLGLRMIADVLEGVGFDVVYLGDDTPAESLRAAVELHRPAVVGLAFGMAANINCLADSLWAIHEVEPDTRVMLGGRAVPLLLKIAGYPIVENSVEAVSVVEKLLAGPSPRFPSAAESLRSDTARWPWPPEDDAIADPVARRLAEAAEDANDVARRYVRRAGANRDQALTDRLTSLANRRAFDDELSALARESTAGSMLLIDVDHFKAINETHGQQVGDDIVRAVGRSIRDSLRPGDMIARTGGDEFAVLLLGASPEVALEIGDQIRGAVAERVRPAVTASVGVAKLGDDPRSTMLLAETALYAAKTSGRDRTVDLESVV